MARKLSPCSVLIYNLVLHYITCGSASESNSIKTIGKAVRLMNDLNDDDGIDFIQKRPLAVMWLHLWESG